MKKIRHFLVAVVTLLAATATMAQNGFNYQAVIRDGNGNLLVNQKIALRITLLNGDNSLYQEKHTLTTNAYGAISVVVGTGTILSGTSFDNVPWSNGNISMRTEFNPDPDHSSTFDMIGTTLLQSVPFAEYAKTTGEVENPTNIKIQATSTTGDDEALFEVKDNDGKVVFAVYKNGVRVYVDETDSKAAKSGFAVAGKSGKAGEETQYFSVNASGTKVYVDDDTVSTGGKAAKAKFAVAGKSGKADDNYFAVNGYGTQVYVDESDNKAAKATFAVAGKSGKGVADNYFVINDEGTKVFVDGVNGQKAAKATFAVASVRSGKADVAEDFFLINKDGTKVFIDEETHNNKAAKATFAVASVKKGKDGAANTNPNYLTIDNESTRIYIDEAPTGGKAAKSGFAVAGKSGGKAGEQNLFNIDLTQTAEVINDENRVFWYPKKNAFLAGRLNVTSADSVGENSFNAGYQNKAIGNYSQALGFQSRAKGEYATAIGRKANADKDNAYAFGNNAKALGAGSYAIGADAIATGMSSFAIGSVGQDSLNNPLPSAKATGDYAYAIGAGTVSSAKGALATGVNTEASGDFSTAMGYMVKATAYGSVAIGTGHIDRYVNGTEKSFYTTARGKYSAAIGYETYANGDGSVALGYRTTTSGNGSFSAGGSSSALGMGSVAVGASCYANRNNAVAIGASVRATGEGAVAIGRGYAYGKAGQVHWRAEASGKYSTVIGYASSAASYCETAIGTFNTTYTPLDTVIFNASDRLFVVGNGTRYTDKSDALIVYKNGNMTVNGTITHSGLVGPSDIRLKKDIQPLNGALDKILQLRGVSFYWKNKEEMAAAKGKDVNNFSYGFDSEKQIGVIAQEIEKVVPELVVTDNEGFKAVKYENLTPLLIEAIKEQNKKIEELEAKLKEMDDLKRMVEELMKKQ